ncbi:hypothetical protein BC826DRAFT_1055866 [Russula brevipes]|nr:hypothetical protein BC826DRAFT_1055866 [Russula brevipes]
MVSRTPQAVRTMKTLMITTLTSGRSGAQLATMTARMRASGAVADKPLGMTGLKHRPLYQARRLVVNPSSISPKSWIYRRLWLATTRAPSPRATVLKMGMPKMTLKWMTQTVLTTTTTMTTMTTMNRLGHPHRESGRRKRRRKSGLVLVDSA